MTVAFKICGLTRATDARTAANAGATYGGVILASGSPRTISPALAAEVFSDTPLLRVGVFVNESIENVARIAASLRLSVVQLHGDESAGYVATLRETSPTEIWKVIRPRGAEEFRTAVGVYGELVDGLMVDAWSDGARGGTGKRFPWAEIARVRQEVPANLKFVVAGGLNPRNVEEAIRTLAPDVVDVSSGVELSPGIKDPSLIQTFAAAVLAVGALEENSDGSTVRR